MSEKVALYRALEALGSVVTFREESHELAFGEFLAELRPSDEELEDAEREGDVEAGGKSLEDLSKAELLAMAQAQGLDVSANSTKAEIVAALEGAGEGG